MLGRKHFTREEVDRARTALDAQLSAYRTLVAPLDPDARADFDQLFFRHLLLALDRPFVHRVRMVSGKDGNPLNEVELLADAVLGDGVLRPSTVIRLVPEESVTGTAYGDPVRLDLDRFERLAKAFFAELGQRYAEA